MYIYVNVGLSGPVDNIFISVILNCRIESHGRNLGNLNWIPILDEHHPSIFHFANDLSYVVGVMEEKLLRE